MSSRSSENQKVVTAENTEAKEAQQLLTVNQAASYFHISASSIRCYIRQGKLKAFRIAGLRKVLIPRAELLTLLQPTNFRND
jgi:excisionase family DNA binding protein